jgi:hypothetical protein
MEIRKSKSIVVEGIDGVQELWRLDDEITLSLDRETWTLDAIRELRDALNAALEEGCEERREEGPWERIEDVPASVRRVIDKDGDPWSRESGDPAGYFAGESFEYLNRYAPFRRG